jgi:TatD DNase family protein
MLIDTHAHLTFDELHRDLAGALARARSAGVSQIITVGTTAADSARAVEIAAAESDVWATVGIHPHEAARATDADLAAVRELGSASKVAAVGETGLDYHYDFSDRSSQQRLFEAQLAIADDLGLPVVIHCREAVKDAVTMLKAAGFEGRPVVFHCFTDTAEEAERIAAHGWRISFTGIVTFKNAQAIQDIARQYPADQLMLETDAPYLSPVPVRSVRPNEPAHLVHTARFLATLRGEDFEGLASRTTANARAFFPLA